MLFTEPSCHEVVLSTWESTSIPNKLHNLLSKLDKCMVELRKWSEHTFSDVGSDIRKLEQQLHS